jgi:protease-4
MKTKWKILITLTLVVFFVGVISLGILLLAGLQNELPLIGKKVAIIPIKGEITTDGCKCNIFGCEQCAQVKVVKEMLEGADNDNEIRAIVLDINSGGGGVIASNEIMQAVKKTKKPVVARIGELGASGAYYVASAADKIVADKNSITGSIGVVMYFQQYYGLMEKLGLNMTVIKAGNSKDIGSPYRPMKEEERRELKGMVDSVYENLIQDIAENRGLDEGYVRNISDGSIYIGSEAKSLGLIDELGNLDDAINIAGKLGEIKGKPSIKEIGKRKSLWDLLFGG